MSSVANDVSNGPDLPPCINGWLVETEEHVELSSFPPWIMRCFALFQPLETLGWVSTFPSQPCPLTLYSSYAIIPLVLSFSLLLSLLWLGTQSLSLRVLICLCMYFSLRCHVHLLDSSFSQNKRSAVSTAPSTLVFSDCQIGYCI